MVRKKCDFLFNYQEYVNFQPRLCPNFKNKGTEETIPVCMELLLLSFRDTVICIVSGNGFDPLPLTEVRKEDFEEGQRG